MDKIADDELKGNSREISISDPLYEPLKLTIHPKCRHFDWLSIFCHSSFGFSPSIVYDAEKMKMVSEEIFLQIACKKSKNEKESEFENAEKILQFRANVISKIYHKELMKIVKLYLCFNKTSEAGLQKKTPDSDETEKLYELNDDFFVYSFLRILVLTIFKEMQREYLKILHGEILEINGKPFGDLFSKTIFTIILNNWSPGKYGDLNTIDWIDYRADFDERLREAIKNYFKTDCGRKINDSQKDLIATILENIFSLPEEDYSTSTEEYKKKVDLIIFDIKRILSLNTNETTENEGENDNNKNNNCKKSKKLLGTLAHIFKENGGSLNKLNPDANNSINLRFVDGYLYQYNQEQPGYPIRRSFSYDNYRPLSSYFRTDNEHKIRCPICGKNNWMSEHDKLFDLKNALLKSFEMRRAKWLLLTASLQNYYRGATHTRLAHQIGTMMVAFNAINLIKVNVSKNNTISLAEYLSISENTFEFLLGNVLHDIGHSPLSHVLETNPFLDINHEDIAKDLIVGGIDWDTGDNWYKSQFYYLTLNNTVSQLKNYETAHPYESSGKELKSFIEKIHCLIRSDNIFVKGILENFGLYPSTIVKLIDSDNKLCKQCEGGKTYCDRCNLYSSHKQKRNPQDIEIINLFSPMMKENLNVFQKLLDSEIDFDRIDHIRRDSDMSGASLVGSNLDDLLGSLTIIMPECDTFRNIKLFDNTMAKQPHILISENGMKYFLDLLYGRQIIYREVLFSVRNNWINGVTNQMTSYVIQQQPHVKNILPFITDQIIYHLFSSSSVNNSESVKYNRLLQGKLGFSLFGEPYVYKFKFTAIPQKISQDIYKFFNEKNKAHPFKMRLYPGLVFYMNIVPKTVEKGKIFESIERKKWSKVFVYGKGFGNKYYTLHELEKRADKKSDYWGDFLKRPEENDVKGLVYIWVNKLVMFDPSNDVEKTLIKPFKDEITQLLNNVNTRKLGFDEYFEEIYIR